MKDFIDEMVGNLEEQVRNRLDSYQITGYTRKDEIIRFRNSEIKQNNIQNTSGLYLMAIKNKKVRTIELPLSSQDSWKSNLEELIAWLAKTNADYNIPNIPEAGKTARKTVKKSEKLLLEERSQEEKTSVVEQVINTAEIDERTAKVSGIFDTLEVYFRVKNSRGIEASDMAGYHHLRMIVHTKGGRGVGTSDRYFRRLKDVNFEELSMRALMDSLAVTVAQKGDNGQFPVILTPLATQQLVRMASIIFNGHYCGQKRSCLSRVGSEELFDKQLSLLDDPLSPSTVFNMTIDGEGVNKCLYTLIDRGIPVGILHDTDTASKAGIKTTGHKNYPFMDHDRPGPAAYNLILEDGNSDFEEMLTDTRQGILIKEFINLNIEQESGKFTGFTQKGVFLIKNGEIEKPLKEYRVNGEILAVLNNIPLIGAVEEEGLYSCPHVKLGQLRVENV